MNKLDDYNIIRGTGSDEELQRYAKCFADDGSIKYVDNLKWFHRDNLVGINTIFYAIHKPDNELAAIYTWLPAIFNIHGNKVVAMQSFDTLTDSKHRMKGLLVTLERSLVEATKNEDFQLIYGFPNKNSVHGLSKKLGFHLFGEMPFLIKPLRLSFLIKKLLGHKPSGTEDSDCPVEAPREERISETAVIKVLDDFDDSYEHFWQKVKMQFAIGVNRDAAYMNWRYVKKPVAAYYRYGLFENGELKGIVVFTLKVKHGGKIGYIMEMLHLPGDTNTGNILLRFASKYLRKNKADVLLAWCFEHSFNFEAHRKSGFIRFREKYRPVKLYFVAKALKYTGSDIYDKTKWYLSYSDSDTV